VLSELYARLCHTFLVINIAGSKSVPAPLARPFSCSDRSQKGQEPAFDVTTSLGMGGKGKGYCIRVHDNESCKLTRL